MADNKQVQTGEFKKEIGLFGGISVIGGIMIGSGIFYLGSYVLERTNMNLGMALLCWIVGGFRVPLPDRNLLAPLVEGGKLLAEAVEGLVGVHVHGFEGVEHLSLAIPGEAQGDGFVPLTAVEVLDLLLGQLLSVQKHGHLPGKLPELKLHPPRPFTGCSSS